MIRDRAFMRIAREAEGEEVLRGFEGSVALQKGNG